MNSSFEKPNLVVNNKVEKSPNNISYHEYMKMSEERYADNHQDQESLRGKEMELRVLGQCEILGGEQIDLNATKQEMIDFVKDHQPEKQSAPLQWVRQKVAQILQTKVDAYTAVGSPLDLQGGIDAFFEADGMRITVDYAMGDNKKNPYLEEGIVFSFDFKDKTEQEILRAINGFADSVGKEFEEAFKEREKYMPQELRRYK